MKYTFGKTKACENLEKLVEGKPWASRRVSRLLSSYNSKLLNITQARDPETVTTCMELLRDFTLKRVDSTKMDDEVKSHLKNVVCFRYREYRRAFESFIPVLKHMESIRKHNLTSGEKRV